MYEDIVNSNDYIRYLDHFKIDTLDLKKEIQEEINSKQNIFEEFWNRSKELSSPNINLENIIFEKANNYIYKYLLNEFQFDITFKLDMQSLIASKNSLIERPKIKRPSEVDKGMQEDTKKIENFVQIARFENELEISSFGSKKTQHNLFEGLTPIDDENPFFQYLPSALIWLDAFYYPKEEKILGLYKNFNSIEPKYILWMNSLVLNDLGLKLDHWNNGLKAVNNNGDIILEFRCWRDELIDNGASFVGIDSNIVRLEGCDLILREDYIEKLQSIVGKLFFVSIK